MSIALASGDYWVVRLNIPPQFPTWELFFEIWKLLIKYNYHTFAFSNPRFCFFINPKMTSELS